VEYIVSDLAPAMKKAIEEVFPKAIHVLDRFHVIQLITDALMRRRYYLDKKGKHQTVRHMNRLLTSELGLLSEEDRKQVREWCLQDDNLSSLYKGLQHIRYVLKSTSMTQAIRRWNDWVQRFVWNRCSVMRKIDKTLLTKEEAFLSCAFLSLSNGVMEGTNNKIKLLKRRAYGYRNDERFFLRTV
jgi:transposase